MSVFDDAMSDWIDGGCKGTVEDYVNDPTLAIDDLEDDDDEFEDDFEDNFDDDEEDDDTD